MILTKEIFKTGISSNNGYNLKQLQILGYERWTKGWAKNVIGKDFPEETINIFLQLKDTHLSHLNSAKINKKNNLYFVPCFDDIPYKQQYLHPNWQKMRLNN